MSPEPEDAVVRRSILASLAKVKIQIRPNKLRKTVCRDVSDTNWTQFQRVLDAMIGKNDINIESVDGEQLISSKEASSGRADELKIDTEKNMTLLVVLKVPRAVKAHLVSKGRKKQRNIEANTKTQISYAMVPVEGMKRQAAADAEVSIKITKSWCKSQDGSISDDEEKAQKHLDTAKLMIIKMTKGYEKNPHHFEAKKAGGTIAEQEESRRIKELALRKRGKLQTEKTAKKKRTKFY